MAVIIDRHITKLVIEDLKDIEAVFINGALPAFLINSPNSIFLRLFPKRPFQN